MSSRSLIRIHEIELVSKFNPARDKPSYSRSSVFSSPAHQPVDSHWGGGVGTAVSAHVCLAGRLRMAKPTCAPRCLQPELHFRVEDSRHRLLVSLGNNLKVLNQKAFQKLKIELGDGFVEPKYFVFFYLSLSVSISLLFESCWDPNVSLVIQLCVSKYELKREQVCSWISQTPLAPLQYFKTSPVFTLWLCLAGSYAAF